MPVLKTRKTKIVEKEVEEIPEKTLLVLMPIGLNVII